MSRLVELEAALAQMTAERDGLKEMLHLQMSLKDDYLKAADKWSERAELAEAHVVRLQRAAAWQLIDTAPKDGTAVLLYSQAPFFAGPAVGHWHTPQDLLYPEYWSCGGRQFAGSEIHHITHWMSLPAPPEAIAALPPTAQEPT